MELEMTMPDAADNDIQVSLIALKIGKNKKN